MAESKKFGGFYVPNSTQVPDDIFDVWMPVLSGAELKVLMYIARRTLGFKKQQDAISISQMVNGITKRNGEVLDRGTGLSRASAIRAAKSLETQGLIVRNKQHSAEKGDEATTYSLKLVALQEKKADLPFEQPQNKQQSRVSEGESKNVTPPGGLKNILPPSPETIPGGVQKSNPQGTGKQDTENVNVNGPSKNQKTAKLRKSQLAELPNLAIPEEEIESLTAKLVQTFADEHSRNYFRLTAAKIPRSVIARTVSDIHKQDADNPSRLFTFRMELYAQEHANDVLYNHPAFQQNAHTLAEQMTIKSDY